LTCASTHTTKALQTQHCYRVGQPIKKQLFICSHSHFAIHLKTVEDGGCLRKNMPIEQKTGMGQANRV
jgi:hypothetical protein